MAVNINLTQQELTFDHRVNHLVHPVRMIISGKHICIFTKL